MTHVKTFVEELLNKKSLVKSLKKVNQSHLTCSDLYTFLKNNFQKLSDYEFNFSLSWFDSSAEIHFARAHKAAYEFYLDSMNEVMCLF